MSAAITQRTAEGDAAMAAQERAKGVCPECGRTVSGRAEGPERLAADRRFVALAPHTRGRQGHHRDGYRKVPRVLE